MEFESPYDPTILLNKQNPYHYTFRRGLIESLYNGTDVYVSEGDLSIAQVGSMSSIGDAIQEKCMNFADKVIKLNDYLLEQESKKEDDRSKKTKSGRIPVSLKSVANLSNQLLRAGTSIGAKQLLEQ